MAHTKELTMAHTARLTMAHTTGLTLAHAKGPTMVHSKGHGACPPHSPSPHWELNRRRGGRCRLFNQ